MNTDWLNFIPLFWEPQAPGKANVVFAEYMGFTIIIIGFIDVATLRLNRYNGSHTTHTSYNGYNGIY